ncbi:MAG TPA: DUF3047 domain-containing protein [Candidatus Omnitrophica bacterium]|nr:DUF3047 domain-containing protein [Candidatus Omnitrophota bacterium]
MSKIKFISFLLLILLIAGVCYAYTYELPRWFPFNKENALDEWEEKIFKNRVIYKVETQKEGGYLSAKSQQACSGLLHRTKFYPKKNPMISWSWKVDKFPDKSKISNKTDGWIEKDDYAARVYVIFPSWIFLNIKSIEYIWDEDLAQDTIITSPYFANIKLIVAESGRDKMGQWVHEERNIYEDYKEAFGRYPSGYVGAVAIMTDTDNTLSNAEASYKDIKIGYKK